MNISKSVMTDKEMLMLMTLLIIKKLIEIVYSLSAIQVALKKTAKVS